MPNAAPGMLALPLLLCGGSLALLATATATAARGPPPHGRARVEHDARVELELAGVLPLPEGPAGILVLREKGKDTLLPLLVADGRGFTPGASGGSLLGRAIEALGARVAEVQIERTEETSAGARVRLTQGGKAVELQAVPSESIALAVSAGVPIVATRRLLDEEGLTPADLAKAQRRSREKRPTRL
ncbi:MAG TPA: bifunctional nuclease domain-containing protein [Anaeromyxobacter sp.]